VVFDHCAVNVPQGLQNREFLQAFEGTSLFIAGSWIDFSRGARQFSTNKSCILEMKLWRSLSYTHLYRRSHMFDPIPSKLIYCVECLLPVNLEETQTTSDGKPVHESCYAYRLLEAEHGRNSDTK